MNWSISFEPLLSWPLLAAVLVPLLVLALAGLWFHQRGAIFRFAALAALAAALLNPVLLDEEREPLKSVVAAVDDHSHDALQRFALLVEQHRVKEGRGKGREGCKAEDRTALVKPQAD